MKWIPGLLILVIAALAPVVARAGGASAWFATGQGRVRLIAAKSAVDGSDRVMLGLQFELDPHWKIYWRSPGDAGYPPHLDWGGSQNLVRAKMAWPAPQRFSALGLETVGYTGTVVLPITARLAQAGAPLLLHARLRYLTCNDICVPHQTHLTLDLPATGGGTGYAGLIAQYAAQVPGNGKAAGIAIESAVLRQGSTPMLDLRVKSRAPLVAPDAFFDTAKAVSFGRPVARQVGGDSAGWHETVLSLPVSGKAASLLGRPLGVTLVDGAHAMTGKVVLARGPDLVNFATFGMMLGLALLGGLILNLMPCVLPVLALKLLAAFPKARQSSRAVRRGFVATAAGVIVSFLVLGLAVAGLKSAGVAVGWGVQFQNPLFVVFLVVVLTLFACNLWGFFEVPLPRGAAMLAERSSVGNFAAGVFATFLATPCSAPFLGTALSFALAAGPREISAIFFAFGIGMAAPYLLVAAVPRLAGLLPRPGRWMIHLRRALGVLLAASAVWLLWVLSAEIRGREALIVAVLMLLAILTLAFLRDAGPRWMTLGVAMGAALLVARFAPPAGVGSAASKLWRPFKPASISSLVRGGHVVFVDVTADWCLTCKVNERLVLDAASVRTALEGPGVVAMRADWTRHNPKIAAYLGRFDRYGIPFNAVYGPGAPGGLPLPELLTRSDVTTALAEAAGH